ncbi:MAG: hypothetical protein HC898_08820 [Phycisphaerales bacterium]|nr:hypothetical protein [Phycisphaerales bacterium]
MKKTRIMIGLVFMVAFAAGVSSALLARQFAEPAPRPRGPWMTAELKLTPEQEKQMQEIWGTLGRSGGHEESENRRALQKQRDDSIKALIPAERQADLEKLLEDYQRQMNELSQQRKQRFEAAVEKTKAMLTPEQREKFESILARRPDGPRRGGPHGPGSMGGSGPKPG